MQLPAVTSKRINLIIFCVPKYVRCENIHLFPVSLDK
jgi:hypothetical protein